MTTKSLLLGTTLVLTTVLLAGCLGAGPDDAGGTAGTVGPIDPDRVHVEEMVAHTGTVGPFLPSADWQELRVRLAETGFRMGEPTLGVASDGTIFVTAPDPLLFGQVLGRSTDHGQSWETVGNVVTDPKVNLDPWMWLDPWTDRIYNSPLYVVCTHAAWSDDQGETWLMNPIAGCGLPAHDHQKLTSGPPAEGVSTTPLYENVLYYSYNSFRREGTWITTSLDGGHTWGLGGVAHPSDCHGGVAGPVAVGPNGTAYSPKAACDGANVAVSHDSGASWEVTAELNEFGVQQALAVNPDVAVDADGNAFLIYPGKMGPAYMSRTTDQGGSWSDPVRISPPDVTVTMFSVVAAGEGGHVAFGYLGTTTDPAAHDDWDANDAGGYDPEDAPDDVVWHLYLTFTRDGLADDPTFVTARVTPDDDPVQRGCIWQSGGGNPCRNMLDFIDMVQHEGRAYLVFADGCDACDSAGDSRDRHITVAIVEEGPALLEGAFLEALVPEGGADGEAGDGGADGGLGSVVDGWALPALDV